MVAVEEDNGGGQWRTEVEDEGGGQGWQMQRRQWTRIRMVAVDDDDGSERGWWWRAVEHSGRGQRWRTRVEDEGSKCEDGSI